MTERLKNLRKALNLTQQEFASRIGSVQNTITGYETGRRIPSNQVITLICKTFNANEAWLRTGEGDMFQQDNNSILQRMADEYNLSNRELAIIAAFLKLNPGDRAAVMRYMDNIVDELTTNAVTTVEQEARAEADRYYREIIAEKKQESQASTAKELDAG